MEAEASLQCCFLSKIHKQATMCKRVPYRDAIAMNCFAMGVFFGLLHTNGGIELVGSAPYSPFDLVARTHVALCH